MAPTPVTCFSKMARSEDCVAKAARSSLPRSIGSQPAAAEPAEPWPEARLMQPLRSYLEGAFRGGLDLPADGIGIVQILPRWVRREGVGRGPISSWSAPCGSSFCPARRSTCMVSNSRQKPAVQCSRFTKPWRKRDSPISAIWWHCRRSETRLAEIEDHCGEHGIGLIRMRDPSAIFGGLPPNASRGGLERDCEFEPLLSELLAAWLDGLPLGPQNAIHVRSSSCLRRVFSAANWRCP